MNMIRRVAVLIKGGPGGVGLFALNPASKETFGANGGIFVTRKPTTAASPNPIAQRLQTSRVNVLGTAVAAVTLDGTDDGDTVVANNSAATVVATLPKTSVVGPGYRARLIAGVLPGAGAGTTLTPNAADKFQGNGFNAKTAGQTLVNSAASDVVGDLVEVISDGAGIWYVINKVGTWA
jgi:hypothetical protein